MADLVDDAVLAIGVKECSERWWWTSSKATETCLRAVKALYILVMISKECQQMQR